MKASDTSTERLKLDSRPLWRLASMNSSMSGWSHRQGRHHGAAPREPALMMVRHIASHTSMKETGPDASAPTPLTSGALGPQGGKIIADAAALLQRQRRFAQGR